jgi:hypothetical protein
MCALGPQAVRAFAQPEGCLPTVVLQNWGGEAPWPLATALCGIARRPGPFDAHASRMRVARFGNGPLLAPRAGGRFGRHSAQDLHACARGLAAREVPHYRPQGERHRALLAPPGLVGVDHGMPPPRLDLLAECLGQTPQALGVLRDGPDVFWKDHLLRRGGADDFREPPAMGRAPMGPIGILSRLQIRGRNDKNASGKA